MLLPRIIPCLLIRDGNLIKTVNFENDIYIGDVINAVKIFNEKNVDEIILLDIDATTHKKEPNYKMISHIASECRMPMCYGGGIKNIDQVKHILSLGVEKISISSSAIKNPSLIKDLSSQIGSQSVVVTLDIKKKNLNDYEIYTHNGKQNSKASPIDFCKIAEKFGAGEIIINSIDNDGKMNGFDFLIIEKLIDKINIPLTIMGGAGSLSDLKKLFNKFQLIGGAACGSAFIFKGINKAVLINYPSKIEKEKLF